MNRPEETRQRNEHTPCSTEGKVRSRPTTPNLQHKHHKHKHGKKQLAPRKLCFDGSGMLSLEYDSINQIILVFDYRNQKNDISCQWKGNIWLAP